MRKVVVVGHEDVISELTAVLRRDLSRAEIVTTTVVGPGRPAVIMASPLPAGSGPAVVRLSTDTVAILACREMMGARLRASPGP
jgi:hypothetical protein